MPRHAPMHPRTHAPTHPRTHATSRTKCEMRHLPNAPPMHPHARTPTHPTRHNHPHPPTHPACLSCVHRYSAPDKKHLIYHIFDGRNPESCAPWFPCTNGSTPNGTGHGLRQDDAFFRVGFTVVLYWSNLQRFCPYSFTWASPTVVFGFRIHAPSSIPTRGNRDKRGWEGRHVP